jgi:molecular chaperone DnaK (HSP70)
VQQQWPRLCPGGKAPDDTVVTHWLKQFKEMGSVTKQKFSGQPGTLEECVEYIKKSFVRSPKKSIAHQEFRMRDSKNYDSKHHSQAFTPLCLHDSVEA